MTLHTSSLTNTCAHTGSGFVDKSLTGETILDESLESEQLGS